MRDDKAWSKQAEEYQKLVSGKQKYVPMVAPTAAMLESLEAAKPLSTAVSILDCGSGTGQSLFSLLKKYGSSIPDSARIIASDFSEGMLESCREAATAKAAEEGNPIYTRIETQVLDMQDMTAVPEGSQSHALSSFCLGIVPDNPKALREVYRVLAPGGVFAQVTWSKIAWIEWVYKTLDARWPSLNPPLPWPKEFTSEAGVKELFTDAGFTNVQTKTAIGVLGAPDHKSFVTMFSRSKNPGLNQLFKNLKDESELQEAEKVLEDDLAKNFPDGEVLLAGEAIVVTAFKDAGSGSS
jgi:ubiquinone/menaquinone biosynthesis C-methylase UbiE